MNIRRQAPVGLLLIAVGAVATCLLSGEATPRAASAALRGAPRTSAPSRTTAAGVAVAPGPRPTAQAAFLAAAPGEPTAQPPLAKRAPAAPLATARVTDAPAAAPARLTSALVVRQAPAEETRALKRAVARIERQRQVERRVTKLRRQLGFAADDPATEDLELLLSAEPSPFAAEASDDPEALLAGDDARGF